MTMYFCKVTLSVPASTSSFLLPLLPLGQQDQPPLPLPTQCLDNENQDLYNDPLPFNK